jgi:hypothetical protein
MNSTAVPAAGFSNRGEVDPAQAPVIAAATLTETIESMRIRGIIDWTSEPDEKGQWHFLPISDSGKDCRA